MVLGEVRSKMEFLGAGRKKVEARLLSIRLTKVHLGSILELWKHGDAWGCIGPNGRGSVNHW
jgi:ASC-1-like (ASCH) protein